MIAARSVNMVKATVQPRLMAARPVPGPAVRPGSLVS